MSGNASRTAKRHDEPFQDQQSDNIVSVKGHLKVRETGESYALAKSYNYRGSCCLMLHKKWGEKL